VHPLVRFAVVQICSAYIEALAKLIIRGTMESDSSPVKTCRSVGPQLAIVNESGAELGRGQIGRIAVQGPPNFHGYENVEVRLIL
jgi:hypothetical protein